MTNLLMSLPAALVTKVSNPPQPACVRASVWWRPIACHATVAPVRTGRHQAAVDAARWIVKHFCGRVAEKWSDAEKRRTKWAEQRKLQ